MSSAKGTFKDTNSDRIFGRRVLYSCVIFSDTVFLDGGIQRGCIIRKNHRNIGLSMSLNGNERNTVMIIQAAVRLFCRGSVVLYGVDLANISWTGDLGSSK